MNNLDFLLSIESKGIKLGLDRTFALLNACGNPHNKKNIIQIVGTNGKGTTSYMINKILLDAGYKVGLFTSPHLSRLNERIRINGIAISDEDINRFIIKYKNDILRIDSSFFEVMTVLGFWFFNRSNVDYSIMETGLGGRLDSVSACNPAILGITSISNDHKEILGNNLDQIALEKAGAMKKNSKCISVQQDKIVYDVLLKEAHKKNVKLDFIEEQINYDISINGNFQKINASLAKNIINIIDNNISNESIKKSLNKLNWYGRIQILASKPLIIFDVCHNVQSISGFLDYIDSLEGTRKKNLIIAIQKRKNIDSIIDRISRTFNNIIVSSTGIHDTLSAKLLFKKFNQSPNVRVGKTQLSIEKFISESHKSDLLAIIGTHYLGPEISKFFKINFDNL